MKVYSHKSRIRRSEAFLGIHFDFHAGTDCTEIGKTLTRRMLCEMLELVKPDYVQCDCKGHPGLASYPTRVGTPARGFVRDPLKLWREVTAEYGVSLYVHYSGVVDHEAVKQHPEWAARQAGGELWPGVTSVFGPYVEELMIPMFKELIDRYGIDGAWVDGECWGVEMDYSDHAQQAWKAASGLEHMPETRGEKHFESFREFQREGFRNYVKRYVDQLHAHAPDFEIASNWAYTGHMPESVKVDVDFLSGDITPQQALKEALMDARLLAQQGKPWDLMSWSFNGKWGEPGQTTKTALQLQQEAAVVMAAGGGFQAYFKQKRDASIYPWTMGVMAETAAFCRARQPYCHRAQAVPQIGLILSRQAYYRHIDKLMRPWGRVYQAFRGVLCNLLDSQHVVDVVMDHNLATHTDRYPLLVLPEWKNIGSALKRRLIDYVEKGGNLLVIGADPTRLFYRELRVELEGKPADRTRFIEVGDRLGGIHTRMQVIRPLPEAGVHGWLYEANEATGPRIPAAVATQLGEGRIAAVPMNMGERYSNARTTVARDFLNSVVKDLLPQPMVEVSGSHLLAVSLMQKNGALMVNLVNTGGPHHGSCYTFDELPAVGPVEVRLRLSNPPKEVRLQPDSRTLAWRFADGCLVAELPRIDVHEILEVGMGHYHKQPA